MPDPQSVSLFSDSQVAVIVAALVSIGGALAGTIKWAVGRVTKALDDNSQVHREVAASNVEHATAMAVLSTKIDSVSEWVEEHTPVTDPESPRSRHPGREETGPTPQGGYGLRRPPTTKPVR